MCPHWVGLGVAWEPQVISLTFTIGPEAGQWHARFPPAQCWLLDVGVLFYALFYVQSAIN